MHRLRKVPKVRKLGDMKRDKIYTVATAADMLGVHPATIRRWDQSGVLKPDFYTVTGHRRYYASTLEKWSIQGHVTPDSVDFMSRKGLVYFFECDDFIKIGFSVNPESRLRQIQVSGNGTAAPQNMNTREAKIITAAPGTRKDEMALHDRFAATRDEGEWFKKSAELTDYVAGVASTLDLHWDNTDADLDAGRKNSTA